MAFESVSRVQKYRFRSDFANRGRTCDAGLFAISGRANYFGEILLRFGIFTICVGPSAHHYVPDEPGARAAQHAAIIGPMFLTMLLLLVSGLTLQERPGVNKRYEPDGPDGERWLQYRRWTEQTGILFSLPPAWWVRLPTIVKCTTGFELPIYVFDPEKHADDKKMQAREAGEGSRRHDEDESVEQR